MSALEVSVPAPSELALVAHEADADATQLRAEGIFLRSIIRGMAIGVVVCAAIWVGLVAAATVHNGIPSWPLMGMGAGCGMFGGLFLGGTAGAMLGSHALEQVEHDEAHAAHAK